MSADRLEALRAPLAAVEGDAWIVGGGLRDALLGREVADVDIAVAAPTGDAAARRLARATGAGRFRLSAQFGSWRLTGGTLPFQVDITPLQGPTLGADLALRDFTVNALALPLHGPPVVVDPAGGLADLARACLRATGPGVLRADPVRVLRGARIAEQIGFRVEPGTRDLARAAAPGLWDAAPERLRDEVLRMAALPAAWRAFELLDGLGALGVLVPELEACRGLDQSDYHHRDVLGHTLEVVRHGGEILAEPASVFGAVAPRMRAVLDRPLADGVTRGQAMIVACLLHDMAKPATRAVTPEGRVTFWHHDRLGAEDADRLLVRLRSANRLRELVVTCIREHLRLGFLVHRQPLSLRQQDRYLRATAPAEVELTVLTVADRLATRGPRSSEAQLRRHLVLAREMMDAWARIEDREPLTPPLRGDEIARHLGRAPGPWLAALLRDLREEQLMRPGMTAARALAFARGWVDREDDR